LLKYNFAFGLAAFACPVSASAAPLPDAVPIEVFAALPSLEAPKLSPNGDKVAAKISVGEQQTFVVTPLFGKAAPKALSLPGSDINWWRWVNDDWLVVGVGDRQKFYGYDVYITRTLGVSADMAVVNRINWDQSGEDADQLVWAARDGSPKILLGRQTGITAADIDPTVFEVDVSTGKSKIAVRPVSGVFTWSADSAGNVRVGYQFDNGQPRHILYRGPKEKLFQPIDLPKTANRVEMGFGLPLPSIFRTDGSAIAIDDHIDQAEVYEIALPSFALGKKLFGNSRYDVEDLIANQTGDDIDGIGLTEKRYRVEWLNPALKDLQDGLDDSFGPGNAAMISWSRDRSKMLVEVGMPSQAGAIFYWDTESGQMKRIAWTNDALKDRTLSPVKTIEYKARDGTPIEAVLTLPRGREAKELPLIVLPHGGPAARDSEQFDWWTQFLAEQGYAVIQPNYRGSSGYGKKFAELGEGEWGLKMQDDLLDAITWAADQGIADRKRVCIVGGSYGGYAAMRGAQRDGANYRCAVSYAGISDIGAMREYDKGFLTSKFAKAFWKRQVSDFAAVSPRFHATDFSAPILIAHGTKDKRVPVKQSRMLVDELKKAGKNFEYLEQREGDHHLSRGADRLEFLKALKAFLDKYNPA
jgi:dienelactone hydrolase